MKIGIRRIELLFFIITMLFCSNKIFASAYTGGTGSTVISTLPKDNEKETSDSGSSSSSRKSSSKKSAPAEDVAPEDIGDEPIDLSEIPF